MEYDRKELIAKIEKAIGELPTKAQTSIFWMIEHMDYIEAMCKYAKMTAQEIEECRMDAIAKEDYSLQILLCAVKMYENEGDKKVKQEN